MDVYCSYTTETGHENVIACGVSELVHLFFSKVCMFVCAPETQREGGVRGARQGDTQHVTVCVCVNIKKMQVCVTCQEQWMCSSSQYVLVW